MPLSTAILTISLGENRNFINYTKNSMENYARKINSEFILISKWDSFVDKKTSDNRFIKLEIIHFYCKQYDRLIYLDDTVYITPNCKDLFNLVPESHLGAFIESKIFNRNTCMREVINHYSQYDKWDKNSKNILMINSGVMVLSKIHFSLFDTSKYVLKNFGFTDQAYISYQICRQIINVYDINNTYNYVGSQIMRSMTNKIRENAMYETIHIFHVTSFIKDRKFILKKLIKRFEEKK